VALLFFTWGAGVRPTVSDEGPYDPSSFLYIYIYIYIKLFLFISFFIFYFILFSLHFLITLN
jgi:hypothetical protein